MDVGGLLLILLTATVFAIAGVVYSRRLAGTLEEFVVTRNSLGLGAGAATLIASGMGAWILFAPAETTVTGGILALVGYALGSGLALCTFIWLGTRLRQMMPRGHALTEYVLLRFGGGMYVFVLIVMVFYMAVYLAAELRGIALAARMVFQVPVVITVSAVCIGTLAYTAIGGFPASVFTDRLQTWLILPLLAVVFVASVAYLGGPVPAVAHATQEAPAVLDWTSRFGVEYAVALILAIVAAELFNQANWQRVYALSSDRVLRMSFAAAGIVVALTVLVAGSFGVLAVASDAAAKPSVALFTFLLEVTPRWLLLAGMVLAVALVMSSIDSLLNGLASLFAVDLVRIFPTLAHRRQLTIARWFTVLLACLAALVAVQELSVLYLFLVADVVCVAAAVPTYLGLFVRRCSGVGMLLASVAGIVAGAAFFPDPAFTGASLLTAVFPGFAFGAGSLMKSFAAALIAPIVLSLFVARTGPEYDFKRLESDVQTLDAP